MAKRKKDDTKIVVEEKEGFIWRGKAITSTPGLINILSKVRSKRDAHSFLNAYRRAYPDALERVQEAIGAFRSPEKERLRRIFGFEDLELLEDSGKPLSN